MVFQYANKFNAYVIYITKHNNIVQMDEENLNGINIHVRNESLGNAQVNWRFSETLTWRGKNNITNINTTNFHGIVI